jgi:hypothetical protein
VAIDGFGLVIGCTGHFYSSCLPWSLSHAEKYSQSRCLATAFSGGLSCAFGLTSLQAGCHLTPTNSKLTARTTQKTSFSAVPPILRAYVAWRWLCYWCVFTQQLHNNCCFLWFPYSVRPHITVHIVEWYDLVNNELKRRGTKVSSYFEAPFWDLPAGTEESHENISYDSRDAPNTKQELTVGFDKMPY